MDLDGHLSNGSPRTSGLGATFNRGGEAHTHSLQGLAAVRISAYPLSQECCFFRLLLRIRVEKHRVSNAAVGPSGMSFSGKFKRSTLGSIENLEHSQNILSTNPDWETMKVLGFNWSPYGVGV